MSIIREFARFIEPTGELEYDNTVLNNLSASTIQSAIDELSVLVGAGNVGSQATFSVYEFVATASQTTFDLAGTFTLGGDITAGNFVIGETYKIQTLGDTDWNVAAGTTGVTYNVGDVFTADAVGSGTGVVRVAVTYPPGYIQVFVNGIFMAAVDYTASNGRTVVLAEPAELSDLITVVILDSFDVATQLRVLDVNASAPDNSLAIDNVGDVSVVSDIKLADNGKVIFGDSSDLQIYHDGSASFINDSGTGNLKIQGTQLQLQNAAGTLSYLAGVDGGATSIHYAGFIKLATTSTGIDITGTVTADGATFAGATSIEYQNPLFTIKDTVAGGSSGIQFKQSTDAETGRIATTDADLMRFYTGSTVTERMEINSTGIDVTGTVTADGLTVDTTSPVIELAAGNNNDSRIVFSEAAADIYSIKVNGTSGSLQDFTIYHDLTSATTARFQINQNGDISFYEDTGTTAKLFWDASAESLGIGTASPAELLHIESSTNGEQVDIRFRGLTTSAGAGRSANIGFDPDPNDTGTSSEAQLYLSADTTNKTLVATASGNVGIGTSSPEAVLTSMSTGALTLTSNDGDHSAFGLLVENSSLVADTVNSAIGFASDAGRKYAAIGAQTYSDLDQTGLNFYVQPSANGSTAVMVEAMRIDKDGNLMVGKTATNLASDGVQLFNDGFIHATATQAVENNGTVASIRRSSTDGSLVDFYKDGTTVGSIGVESIDNLYIDCNTADHAGLLFWSGASSSEGRITPRFNGTSSDAAVDLGRSENRFKDLHLSGGVYLGGTGAANYLDDYEEGTWTPAYTTISGTPTYTSDTTGRYTKIGNLVTFSGVITTSALTQGPNHVRISLPTALTPVTGQANFSPVCFFIEDGVNSAGGAGNIQGIVTSGTADMQLYTIASSTGNNYTVVTYNDLNAAASSRIRFSGHYYTA